MREDVRQVLRLARQAADADAPPALDAAVLPTEEDWRQLCDLAATHRLSGFLHRAVSRLPAGRVPPDIAASIRAAWHRQKLRTLYDLQAYRAARAALCAEALPVIVLKGVDLAQRCYPDPGLRPFQDMDLLLRPSDIDVAIDILGRHGYAPPPSLAPAGWLRRFHFHLPLRHVDHGRWIELHWALGDAGAPAEALSFDALYEQSSATPTGDRILRAEVYAAYLAGHADRHGAVNPLIADHPRADELLCHPHSGNRLIWFVDLARLLRHTPTPPERMAAAAVALGTEAGVERSLRLLGRLRAGEPPAPAAAPSSDRGSVADRLNGGLVRRMLRDLDAGDRLDRPLPWLWRTNPWLHLRPIRILTRERPVAVAS